MKALGRLARVIVLVNGFLTMLAFLTATEGCHARLPFALPLSSPSDFVADSRGHLFVHLDFHRAVTEYDAEGRFVRNLVVPGGGGRGLLAVDERDRLFVNKADLLAVFEPGGRLVETHAVPLGGERSWRLLVDGTVANGVESVDDAVAWMLRLRRSVRSGETLFVDWVRKRRPLSLLGNPLLGDAFIGPRGARYEFRGVFAGIARVDAAPAAARRFRPTRLAEMYTYPHSVLAWVIVPYLVIRHRRKRARRLAAAPAAASAGNRDAAKVGG